MVTPPDADGWTLSFAAFARIAGCDAPPSVVAPACMGKRAVLIRPVLRTPPSVAAASAEADALRRLQRFEAAADCCKRGAAAEAAPDAELGRGCAREAAARLQPRSDAATGRRLLLLLVAWEAELPYGLHGQHPRPISSGLRARRQRRHRHARSSAGAASSTRPPSPRARALTSLSPRSQYHHGEE